ncbi:MAG: gamma-glutamyl-gamma-aminobutyrate hydrolase family protein [Candidatus Dormibacteria bacterium]
MRASPMVGLTWTHDIVTRSGSPGENALRYLSLLSRGGLVPVLVTPGTSAGLLSRLDGVVVPGGPDVAPARYGQVPGPHTEASINDLDALELDFVSAARARNLPVLGICRGQQVINVALGGSLHQHVDHPQWGKDPSAAVHDVQILAGTYLHRALGVDLAAVNSGHHQAVDRLAMSLRRAAVSSDGCVEAVEAPDLLVLAVQWHPEEMPDAQSSSRLVEGFAQWMT